MRSTRAAAVAAGFTVVGLVLGALSCDRSKPTGPPPTVDLPPNVSAVFPIERSTFVLYDIPEVWAQFTEDLDSTTVSDHTVYLKIDDARLPIGVRWDAATRRIVVSVSQALNLLQTYTVELSPEIRSVTGVRLGRTYFWQFTTNSLRRPTAPIPRNGVTGESPFARVQWSGNEAVTQTIRYDVFAGVDSVGVAARTVAAAGTTQNVRVLLPRAKWGEDVRVWWSVRATNLVTGEVLEGPTWHFTALGPATATIDSLVPIGGDWGWQDRIEQFTRACGGADIRVGPNFVNGLRWNLPVADTTFRLAGFRWTMKTTALSPDSLPPDVTVWAVTRLWGACTNWFRVPPLVDQVSGVLDQAVPVDTTTVAFVGDPLAAHLEATLRYGGLFGYVFRSTESVYYSSPAFGNGTSKARLVIYRYRPLPPSVSR